MAISAMAAIHNYPATGLAESHGLNLITFNAAGTAHRNGRNNGRSILASAGSSFGHEVGAYY